MNSYDPKRVKPLKGKIFGEVLDRESVSQGGIIIAPGSTKTQKPRKVRVLAVGGPFEDGKGVPQTYRAAPGQVAYFKLAEGEGLTLGDRKRYLILENKDIVAINDN